MFTLVTISIALQYITWTKRTFQVCYNRIKQQFKKELNQEIGSKLVQTITLTVAVHTAGKIEPILLFLSKKYSDVFVTNGLNGSISASGGSACMNERTFLMFIKHFITHMGPFPTRPILLLMNNHKYHLSFEAIEICKESSAVILSFSPHCSHRFAFSLLI